MCTVQIPLTQGQYALVDEADATRVLRYKWCAARTHSGTYYAVRGEYATPEEAAVAYDIKARDLYGEFARLNFP